MTFTLPPLPYEKDALSPLISKETLEFHHGKHHQAYVTKLNELVVGTEFEGKDLHTIIKTAPAGAIFNNAAQIENHTFFWHGLTPGGSQPSEKLMAMFTKSFDSLEGFKAAMKENGLKVFGSGWVWLVATPEGELRVEGTSGATTPLATPNTPLLTIDVWEHAYYLDYQNRRADFIDACLQLLNYDVAEKRLTAH